MKIWQKEKISVEKLQKKLNLRESKRLDVLLNDVSAKMLCLSEIRLYDNLPLLSNKAGLLENKRGLLFLYGICRFMWRILVRPSNPHIYNGLDGRTKIFPRVQSAENRMNNVCASYRARGSQSDMSWMPRLSQA
jgi:hypothetical protein